MGFACGLGDILTFPFGEGGPFTVDEVIKVRYLNLIRLLLCKIHLSRLWARSPRGTPSTTTWSPSLYEGGYFGFATLPQRGRLSRFLLRLYCCCMSFMVVIKRWGSFVKQAIFRCHNILYNILHIMFNCQITHL